MCRYCGQNAGFLRRKHGQCRDLHGTGIQEMVQLAAQAASAHTFNEAALRQTLQAIAQRSRATGEDIEQALEEGFKQGVAHAMSDASSPARRRNACVPSGTTWRAPASPLNHARLLKRNIPPVLRLRSWLWRIWPWCRPRWCRGIPALGLGRGSRERRPRWPGLTPMVWVVALHILAAFPCQRPRPSADSVLRRYPKGLPE